VHELALTESPSLRAQYVDHVEVLDKVKALTFFPDGLHVDAPGVAAYFEVTPDTIKKAVQRNRKELESNGLRVLRGAEYREFALTNAVITEGGGTLPLASSQNSVTAFTRRAILNVGQMLTASTVAEGVRKNLFDLAAYRIYEAMERSALDLAVSNLGDVLAAPVDAPADLGWSAPRFQVLADASEERGARLVVGVAKFAQLRDLVLGHGRMVSQLRTRSNGANKVDRLRG
jgi:hypothetical protein